MKNSIDVTWHLNFNVDHAKNTQLFEVIREIREKNP